MVFLKCKICKSQLRIIHNRSDEIEKKVECTNPDCNFTSVKKYEVIVRKR